MGYQEVLQCQALITVPEKKLNNALRANVEACKIDIGKKLDSDLCKDCRIKNLAFQRFYKSNIPVSYWDLSMDVDFKGYAGLLNKFNSLTEDIHKTYNEGAAVCFGGNHGVGKSMTCANILKKACLTGYTCLYTTLSDVVSLIGSAPNEDKYTGRNVLTQCDYLVLDEFDARHMGSEQSSEFYGRTLEGFMRTRLQNKLPLFLCTNSSDVSTIFSGSLKASVGSLFKGIEFIPVIGSDFRGKKK